MVTNGVKNKKFLTANEIANHAVGKVSVIFFGEGEKGVAGVE
jgi:hypothetical protein